MMATSRSIKLDLGEPEDKEPKTLMEKWTAHKENLKRKGQHGLCAQKWAKIMMAFQAPSELYVMIVHVIPFVFAEYDEWTQYYLKVLVCVLCMEGLANYFCVMLYNTSYKKTKDNPQLNGLNKRWDNPPDQFIPLCENSRVDCNGHVPDGGGLPWKYCKVCEMNVPPRAHHCFMCKSCILKRDHHCFTVGTCIGHKNQRYFVVLAFYAIICGLWGGYLTHSYLAAVFSPTASRLDYFLPVTIYKTLFGNIPIHICTMVYHLYTEYFFGAAGFFYFSSQMTIIAQGKTLYEMSKSVPIKNSNTVNANFVSVFGNFWAFNFLFPMQIIFRQQDDGINWKGVKLDHNANYERKLEE